MLLELLIIKQLLEVVFVMYVIQHHHNLKKSAFVIAQNALLALLVLLVLAVLVIVLAVLALIAKVVLVLIVLVVHVLQDLQQKAALKNKKLNINRKIGFDFL